jgi:hypothetical protein
MSSAAYLKADEDCPIGRNDWLAFCKRQGIRYSPNTIGRNTFYRDDVEICFGAESYDELPTLPSGRLDFSKAAPPTEATRITVSTFYGGNLDGVAAMVALIWDQWQGISVSADPEIVRVLTRRVEARRAASRPPGTEAAE